MLAALAGVTTMLGAAGGWLAARRITRPLVEVSQAARRVRLGDLDTRLPPDADPDLASLVDSFNDMTASLQQRIEREARFTSDVAHELRTPLTAIASGISLARRAELPERSRMALDLVAANIEHFRGLVLDLLEISKYDAHVADLQRSPTDVVVLVRDVVRSRGSTRRW